jgi:hypothetical protein
MSSIYLFSRCVKGNMFGPWNVLYIPFFWMCKRGKKCYWILPKVDWPQWPRLDPCFADWRGDASHLFIITFPTAAKRIKPPGRLCYHVGKPHKTLYAREYWMYYGGPGFLAVVFSLMRPPTDHRKTEKERKLTGAGGGGKEPTHTTVRKAGPL